MCGAIIGINYYAAVRVSFIGAGLLWNRMELLSIARGARGDDAVVTMGFDQVWWPEGIGNRN